HLIRYGNGLSLRNGTSLVQRKQTSCFAIFSSSACSLCVHVTSRVSFEARNSTCTTRSHAISRRSRPISTRSVTQDIRKSQRFLSAATTRQQGEGQRGPSSIRVVVSRFSPNHTLSAAWRLPM